MKFRYLLFSCILFISSNFYSQVNIWKLENFNQASGTAANTGRSISVFGGTGAIGTASTTWGPVNYLYVHADTWAGGSMTKGFKLEVNSQNHQNLTISYSRASDDYNGTHIGPRDFKLQYSLNNVDYTDVPGGTESLTGGTSFDACLNVTDLALPAACSNVSSFFLRWIMTSNTGVKGKTITSVGTSKIANLVIKGTEIPAAPTNIILSSNTISPAAAIGTTIGTLTATDPNSGNTHTFTLTAGVGDTHNGLFSIAGNALKTNASLTLGSAYSVRINANDGTFNYAKSFQISCEVVYPAISGENQTWDYIKKVVFNTINKQTGKAAGGYGSYTALSTTVNKGSTYSLTVENPPTDTIDVTYPEYIKAFFDWNRDGDFTDSDEGYEVVDSVTVHDNYQINITVPSTASEGESRLRVVIWADQTDFPPSAGTIQYGEAEDYTINIAAALPVELTAFTAKAEGGKVLLNWSTASEINNYGFEVERQISSINKTADNSWEKIAFINGNGNCNSPREYSFADENPPDGELQYRLKQIDTDGAFEYYSLIAGVVFSKTGESGKQLPTEFALGQNYPNPFNPATLIKYALPQNSHVRLEVYSMLGEKVVSLVDQNLSAGYHESVFSAGSLTSGIYIYRLTAAPLESGKAFTKSAKMMLVK